jgi:hypothetical protein
MKLGVGLRVIRQIRVHAVDHPKVIRMIGSDLGKQGRNAKPGLFVLFEILRRSEKLGRPAAPRPLLFRRHLQIGLLIKNRRYQEASTDIVWNGGGPVVSASPDSRSGVEK